MSVWKTSYQTAYVTPKSNSAIQTAPTHSITHPTYKNQSIIDLSEPEIDKVIVTHPNASKRGQSSQYKCSHKCSHPLPTRPTSTIHSHSDHSTSKCASYSTPHHIQHHHCQPILPRPLTCSSSLAKPQRKVFISGGERPCLKGLSQSLNIRPQSKSEKQLLKQKRSDEINRFKLPKPSILRISRRQFSKNVVEKSEPRHEDVAVQTQYNSRVNANYKMEQNPHPHSRQNVKMKKTNYSCCCCCHCDFHKTAATDGSVQKPNKCQQSSKPLTISTSIADSPPNELMSPNENISRLPLSPVQVRVVTHPNSPSSVQVNGNTNANNIAPHESSNSTVQTSESKPSQSAQTGESSNNNMSVQILTPDSSPEILSSQPLNERTFGVRYRRDSVTVKDLLSHLPQNVDVPLSSQEKQRCHNISAIGYARPYDSHIRLGYEEFDSNRVNVNKSNIIIPHTQSNIEPAYKDHIQMFDNTKSANKTLEEDETKRRKRLAAASLGFGRRGEAYREYILRGVR